VVLLFKSVMRAEFAMAWIVLIWLKLAFSGRLM